VGAVNPTSRRARRRLLLPLLLTLPAGCVASAQPRFSAEVSSAIAAEPMRRLETPDLSVYYAEGHRPEAERFALWVGGCVRDLQRWIRIGNSLALRKPFIVMPARPLNNAFVMPPIAGIEPASVVTSSSTFDFLVDVGMAPDPALFGCHEMVHWVHEMQIAGFWGFVDRVFGDVLSPQLGLDSWFHEGLATLYETQLQVGQGRMVSPFWEGAFHAGVAGRRIEGGDLSAANRGFVFGNHYLVGSRFLGFLRDRYGEDKLWRLVQAQGTSFFFPLWVSLRFWQVYDKNLSTLLDEFADEVQAKYPVVQRPPEQRSLRPLGHSARYAVARNGVEAAISEDFDQPIRLSVWAADGRLLRRRGLSELLPARTLVMPSTTYISGLSLTADGADAYFVVIDRDSIFQVARLVRYRVASDRLEVVADDVAGPGGAISDDGRSYFFARAAGDRHDLMELDVTSGKIRSVVTAATGVFLGTPRPSPDGRLLVATASDAGVVQLAVFDRKTGIPVGQPIAAPDGAGLAVDPWFVDAQRVLFSSPVAGRFQIFVHDLGTGATLPISRAPYVALAARPAPGGRIRFLNRQGWGWTLDEIALAPAPTSAAAVATSDPAAAPASAPASTPPPAPLGPSPPAYVLPLQPSAPPPGPVLSDAPYSNFDHLFVPQLHALAVTALPTSSRSLWGASLGGGDRLGFHRWALSGYLDFVKNADVTGGGSIGYVNTQLAPWLFVLEATQLSWWDLPHAASDTPTPAAADLTVLRRQRDLTLGAALPFYTHALSLALLGTELRRGGDPTAPALQRLGGVAAALQLNSAEITPYQGERRALALALDAAHYPDRFGTQDFTFTDLRAWLHTRLPVPPSARLGFGLDLRGRALAGAPQGSGMLELGGVSAYGQLFRSSTGPDHPDPEPDLARIPQRFSEPLRGYEDLTLLLERVAIAEARLGYPLIIDRGFASSLVLLPAFFVRQLDLDVFASGAWDTRARAADNLHGAAGGSITLRTLFWAAPLAVRYQVARRLADDRAWVHIIGLGAN
jgi:hypothetical protein